MSAFLTFRRGSEARVHLPTQVLAGDRHALRLHVDSLIRQGTRSLVFECAATEYFDCSIIATLCTTAERMAAMNGVCVLSDLSPALREVLDIRRLAELFTFRGGDAEREAA